jgi:hypothetical protein
VCVCVCVIYFLCNLTYVLIKKMIIANNNHFNNILNRLMQSNDFLHIQNIQDELPIYNLDNGQSYVNSKEASEFEKYRADYKGARGSNHKKIINRQNIPEDCYTYRVVGHGNKQNPERWTVTDNSSGRWSVLLILKSWFDARHLSELVPTSVPASMPALAEPVVFATIGQINTPDSETASTSDEILNNSILRNNTIKDIVCEEIFTDETLDQYEKLLDSMCARYTTGTKTNPAPHVSASGTDAWIYRANNNTKKSTNLQMILEYSKTNLGNTRRKPISIIAPIHKMFYKHAHILIYADVDGTVFFDLNHVINLLDGRSTQKKYSLTKNKIVVCDTRDNKVGGYYIKDFITERSMYEILINSTSDFADEFRYDVVSILTELSKRGKLVITNSSDDHTGGSFNITPEAPPTSGVFVAPVSNVHHFFDKSLERQTWFQTYSNPAFVEELTNRINFYKTQNFHKYIGHDKRVMYMGLIGLPDPLNKNRALLKIGYSEDILGRLKTLKSEYNGIALLGLRTVNGIRCERNFHTALKLNHGELHVPITIKGQNKDEVYVADEAIIRQFMQLPEVYSFDETVIEAETEINNMFDQLREDSSDEFIKTAKLYQLAHIQHRDNQMQVQHQPLQHIDYSQIDNEYQETAVVSYNTLLFDSINKCEELRDAQFERNHLEKMREMELRYGVRNRELDLQTKELDYLHKDDHQHN